MFHRYSRTVRVISLFCVSVVLLVCFFSPWGSLPVSMAETEKSLAKTVQQLQQKLLNYRIEQQQQTQLQTQLRRAYQALHRQHLELLGRYETLQQRVLSLELVRLLWIQTHPAGATVWINGKRQPGVTPMLRPLVAGRYQLKLTLADYSDHEQTLELAGASSSEIVIPLKPKRLHYRLMVSVNKSPVEVRLGKELIATLTTMGIHSLRLVGWVGQTATLKFTQTRTLESVERDITWPKIEDVVIPGVEFSMEEEISIPSIQAKASYIPAGTFMMGSPSSEPSRGSNEDQHPVQISRGFWMMQTEMTQGQYRKLTGQSPSGFKTCGDHCPVEKVSWYDAVRAANKLSAQEKKTPCYTECQKDDSTCDVKEEYRGSNYNKCPGWRLPTEAEWEYAARAGTTSAFHNGTNCISTSEANYNGNYPMPNCPKGGEYRGKTVAVGSFGKNAWGLHDMHGNVWEWVYDWHGSYNTSTVPAVDPVNASNGSLRVLRGGSWVSYARHLRSAYRFGFSPSVTSFNVGFRLSRSLP